MSVDRDNRTREENSLQIRRLRIRFPLSLEVRAGGHVDSERVLLSVSRDYHHHSNLWIADPPDPPPRVAPPLMGCGADAFYSA